MCEDLRVFFMHFSGRHLGRCPLGRPSLRQTVPPGRPPLTDARLLEDEGGNEKEGLDG